MPVVVEVSYTYTLNSPEDAISLANSTGRIHPSKLYECLKLCVDEYRSNGASDWLRAFSSLIKRSEATEQYVCPGNQQFWRGSDTTCVWNVFHDTLKQNDPNLHLIELVVKRVDYNKFTSRLGAGFLHAAIFFRNVKLVEFLLEKFDFHINGIAQVGGEQYTPVLFCLAYPDPRFCEVILELLLAQPGIDLSAGNLEGYTTLEPFLINGKRCVEMMLQDGRYDPIEVGKALSSVIDTRGSFVDNNFSMPKLLLEWEEARLDASEQSLATRDIPQEVSSRILSFVFPSGLVTYTDEDGHSISEALDFFRSCHPLVSEFWRERGHSWEEHYRCCLNPADAFDDAPWQEVTQRFRAFEKRVEKFEQFRSNN